MAYILICAIIWLAAYFHMAAFKEPMEVKPIRSVEDLFD
ncbi:hypothetical protein J2Z70_002404 [Paenibacillus silagei]|jgi:hypothetical protein|uniref:Uncharacterized protein n=1 Tax=Paenibacillus silagei TaxID=1670801 RepID=A0ABS4NQB2_9BACL|nr:hypothetical protein [Paenibacillus silagei]